MPIPPTPVPQYPNVPRTPGVPPVLRQIGAAQNTAVLLVADALNGLQQFSAPQWGIFTEDGEPVISANSVLEEDFRQDYRISTAPQEKGAFMSYNKVQMPFDGRVTFVQSATTIERQIFLQQILSAAASLDLYNLVMPEIVYVGVNIIHHDFRRVSRRGVSMLIVDVWVEQVRVTGTSQFSDTKSPSGANPINGGNIQQLQVQPNSLPVGAIT